MRCRRSRYLRALPVAVAVVVALVGCGRSADNAGHGRGRPGPRSPAQPAVVGGPAPLLVFFKEVQGWDPEASQLVVDANGAAAALITLGGVDGEKKHIFQMAPAQLLQLRHLLARTRLRDTWCCSPASWTYWVMTGGRAWRLQQYHVPPAMRALIDDLSAITAAHTTY